MARINVSDGEGSGIEFQSVATINLAAKRKLAIVTKENM